MKKITKENWKNYKRQQNIEDSESSVFPSRLRHYMEDGQISVKKLAEDIYLTPPTITNYRLGRRCPDLEKFTLLVQSLGVSADYLIGQSNVPHPVYDGFTPKEYELVREFRKLSNINQACALELIRNLSEQDSSNEKKE